MGGGSHDCCAHGCCRQSPSVRPKISKAKRLQTTGTACPYKPNGHGSLLASEDSLLCLGPLAQRLKPLTRLSALTLPQMSRRPGSTVRLLPWLSPASLRFAQELLLDNLPIRIKKCMCVTAHCHSSSFGWPDGMKARTRAHDFHQASLSTTRALRIPEKATGCSGIFLSRRPAMTAGSMCQSLQTENDQASITAHTGYGPTSGAVETITLSRANLIQGCKSGGVTLQCWQEGTSNAPASLG